jgi:hypothetical protein
LAALLVQLCTELDLQARVKEMMWQKALNALGSRAQAEGSFVMRESEFSALPFAAPGAVFPPECAAAERTLLSALRGAQLDPRPRTLPRYTPIMQRQVRKSYDEKVQTLAGKCVPLARVRACARESHALTWRCRRKERKQRLLARVAEAAGREGSAGHDAAQQEEESSAECDEECDS